MMKRLRKVKRKLDDQQDALRATLVTAILILGAVILAGLYFGA